jgi:hypothetical protein
MFIMESMKDEVPPKGLEELKDLLYSSKWNQDSQGED